MARITFLTPATSRRVSWLATFTVLALPLLLAACTDKSNPQPVATGGSSAGTASGGGGSGGQSAVGGSAGEMGDMEPPTMGGAGSGGAPDTAGTGGQSDAGVLTDASDATVDAAAMASFFQVAAIFADSCSGGGGPPGPLHHNCHSVDPFDGNLDLTVTNAYASLVNHPSDINPNIMRVIPGDPDNSLLMRKILYQLPDDGGLGDPMPKGEAIMLHLPDEQIQLIRNWILSGAHPN